MLLTLSLDDNHAVSLILLLLLLLLLFLKLSLTTFCCCCWFVFQAILSDLFPGKEIPDHDYGKLQATIEECLLKKGCQVLLSFSLDSIYLPRQV